MATSLDFNASVSESRLPVVFDMETGDPDDFVTLLAAPGEEIKINFNGKVLSADYSVTGSEGSDLVKVLDRQLSATKFRLDSLQRLYNESSSKL